MTFESLSLKHYIVVLSLQLDFKRDKQSAAKLARPARHLKVTENSCKELAQRSTIAAQRMCERTISHY